MHPRKNRPVLFEVVARTQNPRPRTVPPAAPAAPAAAGEPTAGRSDRPEVGPPGTSPAPAAAPFDWRRLIRLDGREFRVTLKRPHAALAGVGLVVLLMAAFFVGRYSAHALPVKNLPVEDVIPAGPSPEPPPTAAAVPTPGRGRGTSPIATPLAQALQEAPVSKPPLREPAPPMTGQEEPGDEAVLAPDAFYVVVQHFRLRDQERAAAAQDFLRSNGVPCTIRADRDLQLVATEGFASEQQAEHLRQRIVDIGKQYRASGGGYDFASAKARKF